MTPPHAEKHRDRYRRPLADRGRSGSPVGVAPNEIRFREPAAPARTETVEQWMARTGQQAETLPIDASSGKYITDWNGRTVITK